MSRPAHDLEITTRLALVVYLIVMVVAVAADWDAVTVAAVQSPFTALFGGRALKR